MSSKLREELQRISAAITVNTLSNGVRTIACNISPEEVKHIVDTILAEPPRNCDVLSKAEVLAELDDRSFSKEDTIEWLYTEAKGCSDGND